MVWSFYIPRESTFATPLVNFQQYNQRKKKVIYAKAKDKRHWKYITDNIKSTVKNRLEEQRNPKDCKIPILKELIRHWNQQRSSSRKGKENIISTAKNHWGSNGEQQRTYMSYLEATNKQQNYPVVECWNLHWKIRAMTSVA